MYSMSHHPQPINGGSIMDGSGTINPAALNAPVQPPTSSSITQSSPRGVKRSRSPEIHGETLGYDRTDDDDITKPRKRGRPPKSKPLESPLSSTHSIPSSAHQPVQTPQIPSQALPRTSPSQGSPTKSTPTKTAVVKALPTVRDHTTDQLIPEGDEYIPREFDDAGEKKIAPNGRLLDGREYKCRTFFVPNRGDKLFMLATECARVLSYRDSYLLFNKNRSLYKIIANQTEKDDLIQQEILPYSYRSRQIAIVTAKSMFRQFGSRVVQGGRRVRDDYWEAKARKQGFTEEDAAGEKRPGAQKARDAAAEAERAHAASLTLPQGQIIYSSATEGHPSSALVPQPHYEEMRPDYSNVQRPRQEVTGQAYQDRTLPSAATEILTHAQQAAEFNRSLVHQRGNRARFLEDHWQKPHDPVEPAGATQGPGENVPASSQTTQSPQVPTAGASLPGQQTAISHQQQGLQQMMAHQYPQAPGPQSMMAQSPVRTINPQIAGAQIHQRSPGMVAHPQQGAYGYQQSQMWQAQAQQSPMGQPQHPGMQYGQHMPSQSPHMQPSPMHAPPQLHHSSSTGSMQGTPIGYPGMTGMNPPVYPNVQQRAQQIYQQASTSPHHFMQQTSAAAQPGMQGWAPPPQQQQQQQQQQQHHGQQSGWPGF